jgi:hypothetical protein
VFRMASRRISAVDVELGLGCSPPQRLEAPSSLSRGPLEVKGDRSRAPWRFAHGGPPERPDGFPPGRCAGQRRRAHQADEAPVGRSSAPSSAAGTSGTRATTPAPPRPSGSCPGRWRTPAARPSASRGSTSSAWPSTISRLHRARPDHPRRREPVLEEAARTLRVAAPQARSRTASARTAGTGR